MELIAELNIGKLLLPIDLMLTLKLAVNNKPFTHAELANALHVSASQVHRALKRCHTSGLVDQERRQVVKPALMEFLLHGAKYAFPGEIGAMKRGHADRTLCPSCLN